MLARRKRIVAAVVAVALLAGLLGLASSRDFQTWMARRYLAAHPEFGASLGGLTARPGRLEIAQLQIVRDGYSISVPTLEVDLPLFAAWRGNVRISHLLAKGLTVDLTRAGAAASGPAGPALFPSILSRIRLPVDLTLAGVSLEGEAVFPGPAGQPPVRSKLTVTGGGIGAGGTGQLNFAVSASLPGDAAVTAVDFTGRAAVTMSTPRDISTVEINVNASARGPRLPQGATLAAVLAATRANAGEDYSITLESGGRQVALVRVLQPAGPAGSAPLLGAWSLNLVDADVSPFTLGRALPEFRATGGGKLEVDPGASTVGFDGQAELAVNHLESIDPRLAPLGPLTLAGSFDVRHRAAGWEVRRLTLDLVGTGPVLALRALQPFEFNPGGSLLKVTDRDRDLMAVEVRGVPLRWAQLALPDGMVLSGGELRGAVAVAARDDSFSLRTTTPLTAAGITLGTVGGRRIGPADLLLRVSGEYSLQGWTMEVHELTARAGGTQPLQLTGSIGRLAGAAQSLKLKGNLTSDLPSLLTQLGLGRSSRLSAGRVTGDFKAVLGSRRDVEAHFATTDLRALPGVTRVSLPSLGVDLWANWESDGRVGLNLPVHFERAGRKSDLKFVGFATFGPAGVGLESKVSSEVLSVEDAQLLLALVASPDASIPAASPGPFWSGLTGRVGLDFRQVLYGAGQELGDISGTLRLTPDSLGLDEGHAVMSRSGEVKLAAGLDYAGGKTEPYALKANFNVANIDAGAWLLAVNPGRLPALEGRVGLTGEVSGTAGEPQTLLDRLQGRVEISSNSGVTRLLRTNILDQVPSPSTFRSAIAGTGSLLGMDRVENAANRPQNVVEVIKAIDEFQFDQLVVKVTRGPDLGLKLNEFSLISREIRLTGSGEVRYAEGVPMLQQDLALRLQLLAQGQTGRLLARAGLLGEKVDAMGFSSFLVPFTLEGTLGEPVEKELAATLLKAANGGLFENYRGM